MEYGNQILDLCDLINKRTKYNVSFSTNKVCLSVHIYKQGQYENIYNKNLYYEFTPNFEYEELVSDLNKFLNKGIKESRVTA